MMRLYRGWTKDGKEVCGWYCEVEGKHYIIPDEAEMLGAGWEDDMNAEVIYGFIEVIPETVGQFTGLCDKNGKELDWWEGDVFEVHGRLTLFRIIEEQGCFWFRSSITKERFLCYQAAKWANLPEKLAGSQTVFNENPEEKQK